MTVLNPVDIYIYIITIIYCLSAVFFGILVVKKYFRYKHPALLYFGLSYIIVVLPWIAYVVNYTFYIFTENQLPIQIFYFIGYVGILFSNFAWTIAIFQTIYRKYLKNVSRIYAVLVILYIVLFMIFLFTNMELIGGLNGFWKIEYGIFLQTAITGALLVMGITIILFGINARGSKSKEIRFKAVCFFLMSIFFLTGSFIEIIPFIDVALASVSRTMLIFASFFLYLSVIFPNWVKKRFLKE